jgi:hypothetical protein
MVVAVGETTATELVMFPGLMVYVPPGPAPLAVIVDDWPVQIAVEEATAVTVG